MIKLPPSHPALKPDLLAVVRRVTDVLHKDDYKLVFPSDWHGTPHFHARIPGTESWAPNDVREETDPRFHSRFNHNTSGRVRNQRGQFI